MRLRINHITKLEFLPASKNALTEQNIKSGFRATGLVLYDPDKVFSQLNFRLKTPTPPQSREEDWTPRTPHLIKELNNQKDYIKNQVLKYLKNSSSSINEALGQLTKGAEMMMHSDVLLRAELKTMREANDAKNR